MVARQWQWRRQWEGCAYKALAMIEVHTDEALALQRQWWRQSERCTDDALALMKGCDNEALALMIAGRRQWKRKPEKRTYGCGTRAQTKGGTKLWTQRRLKKDDQWRSRQCSSSLNTKRRRIWCRNSLWALANSTMEVVQKRATNVLRRKKKKQVNKVFQRGKRKKTKPNLKKKRKKKRMLIWSSSSFSS